MDASTLLCCLSLSLAAPGDPLDNLDFGKGNLEGWKSQGFRVVSETGGARKAFAVTSRDVGKAGGTARLERSFVIPATAVHLRCRAYAAGASDSRVDVQLLLGDRVVPRLLNTAQGWQPVGPLLWGQDGQAREYSWPVAAHAGKTVRLVLTDDDARPGNHLHCSGFRLVTRGDEEAREFSQHMVRLQRENHLNPMARYDTAHFTALSNADEEFSKARLQNCEMLYRRFFDHFRQKGFTVAEPPAKLMVAIFDTEKGFKAYVGPTELRAAQGFYDTRTNRLVMYDYRQNRRFLAHVQKAQAAARTIEFDLEREQFQGTVERQAREFAADQNMSLILHEVAHQLSFNGGLFSRQGDSPFWAVEGLACYCESTENGIWLGIGKPNPERLRALAKPKGQSPSLRSLVTGDGWKTASRQDTLLFYARSWALFHLLMEERPQTLRNYLKLIYPRNTSDHRLTDFRQAFGNDLDDLERRLNAHIQRLVERQGIAK